MKKSYYKLVLVLLILVFFSGCLVFDNTEFRLSREERREAEDRAKDITFEFFKHHEYPGFDGEELIDLLDEEQDGQILVIDPILGPRYGKDYRTLVDEIENHIFAERPEADYHLRYADDYELRFEYGDFDFREIRTAVLPFRVDFKVFESVGGQEILTDNGTIFFELRRRSQQWWLHQATINFRELGAVSIQETEIIEDDDEDE